MGKYIQYIFLELVSYFSADLASLALYKRISGVPQGAVFGATCFVFLLFFLLIINDIKHASSNTHLRNLAKDTAIFMHDKDIIDLTDQGKVSLRL